MDKMYFAVVCSFTGVYTHRQRHCLLYVAPFLLPATKLGQGNIFSSARQEFCMWGGFPACIAGGIPACLATGGWYPSMPCSRSRGGVSRPTPGGVCIPACTEADIPPPPPPVHGYCHERYASYWNAFLFFYVMSKQHHKTALNPFVL